jgi:hypothetical protein
MCGYSIVKPFVHERASRVLAKWWIAETRFGEAFDGVLSEKID